MKRALGKSNRQLAINNRKKFWTADASTSLSTGFGF